MISPKCSGKGFQARGAARAAERLKLFKDFWVNEAGRVGELTIIKRDLGRQRKKKIGRGKPMKTRRQC